MSKLITLLRSFRGPEIWNISPIALVKVTMQLARSSMQLARSSIHLSDDMGTTRESDRRKGVLLNTLANTLAKSF